MPMTIRLVFDCRVFFVVYCLVSKSRFNGCFRPPGSVLFVLSVSLVFVSFLFLFPHVGLG
eukprot:m.223872 g.223872  ORF g.223872 m.223872 type:complete len:60 (+) comp16342_c0_seq1:1686-1865(+)